MVDRFFNIVDKWDKGGQGLFFFIVLIVVSLTIVDVFKCLTIMFRGWSK
jgi:hypothetical protein